MPGDSRLVSDIVESGEWRAEEEKLLCEARKSEHAERERERERERRTTTEINEGHARD